MNKIKFCLQRTQHNRGPDMKTIKLLYSVISLPSVGVAERQRKNSFHLALLGKATTREEVTAKLVLEDGKKFAM